jgi:hypothetical protein
VFKISTFNFTKKIPEPVCGADKEDGHRREGGPEVPAEELADHLLHVAQIRVSPK